MALIILLLALLPTPRAEPIKPPPGLPPFDPSKAVYDGFYFCDPNWCINALNPREGFARLNAQDPAVRELARQLSLFNVVEVPLPQGWSPPDASRDLLDFFLKSMKEQDRQVQEKREQFENAPPFDPSRAHYDPGPGMWCDSNWCVYDPNGPTGWMYGIPGCPTGQGLMCGWARLDAEDPAVRAAAVNQLANFWCEYLGACAVPITVRADRCPPDHPLCKDITPPAVDRGPGSGGGGGGGDRNPPASADACPAPQIIRFDPAWRIRSWPPNPVVAGQDPKREGIVYEIEVRIPPVIFRRYEKEPDRCEPVPDADGDGKPDRSGSCWTQVGDPPVRWPGDLKPGECRLVEERYPEPVEGQGALAMTLRRSSIEWIQNELAARYPGARVRMPRIRLPVQGQGTVLADRTFVLTARVNPKPVDPGLYDVEIAFNTAGTPVTAPRRILWRTPPDRPQPVYLLETTLVR